MALPKSKDKKRKFTVQGGYFKAKELEQKFKQGGAGPVIYLKDGEDVVVRIAEPPEKWRNYQEHFIKGRKGSLPCIGEENGCVGCEEGGDRGPSERALIPVLEIETKKPKYIKANTRLANDLLIRHKKDKLLDRDYDILRQGEGTDTVYVVDPEEPKNRDLSKYEWKDPEELLNGWVEGAIGGGGKKRREEEDDDELEDREEDEDEKPKKKKKSDEDEEEDEPKKKKKKSDDEDEDEDEPKKKSKKKDEDDEEDSDDDEDEDDKKSSKEEDEDDEDEDDKPRKPKSLEKKKKKKDDDD